jgi:hypothetical protein
MPLGSKSLQMTRKVLGHKSPTASQNNARVTNAPIWDAMEKAQVEMLVAAKLIPAKDNVKKIRKASKGT